MEEVKNDGGKAKERRRELVKIVYANQRRAVKNVFFSSVVIVISLLTYFAYSLSFYFHIFLLLLFWPYFRKPQRISYLINLIFIDSISFFRSYILFLLSCFLFVKQIFISENTLKYRKIERQNFYRKR